MWNLMWIYYILTSLNSMNITNNWTTYTKFRNYYPLPLSWMTPDGYTSFSNAKISNRLAFLLCDWMWPPDVLPASITPWFLCVPYLPEGTKNYCCLPRHTAVTITRQLLIRVFYNRKTEFKLFWNNQQCSLCWREMIQIWSTSLFKWMYLKG